MKTEFSRKGNKMVTESGMKLFINKKFEHKGFTGIIKLQGFEAKPEIEYLITNFQWYTGYVVIPKGHKLYEVEYHKIDVEVHGGLTYGRMESDDWVIGFDCNHDMDNTKYITEDYVISEIIHLINQINSVETW